MADTRLPPELPSTRTRVEGRIARMLSSVPGGLLLRLIGAQPVVVDGRALDAHTQFIVATQARKRKYGMCEPTVAEGRARYRREVRGGSKAPTPVVAVHDIQVPGGDGLLAARHYVPFIEGRLRAPLLLFLHGGGFVIGDLETHDEPCRLICRDAGVHVVSVAYRLAPEHPFPCAVVDSIAALRWALHHADALGADASRVGVGGDSAGGNLAAVAALQLAREGRRVAAQLLIYPTTDANSTLPSRAQFSQGYLLEQRDLDAFRRYSLGVAGGLGDDPRASPLRATDLSLSPPTLLVTAGFDPLRDEGIAFAKALAAEGVLVQHIDMAGLTHGFVHFTAVAPAARHAVRELCLKFRALLMGPETT